MRSSVIGKTVGAIRKRGFFGSFAAALADLLEWFGKSVLNVRDHCSFYKFIDRRKGRSNLVLVLVGYKEYLWPATLKRVYEFQSDDMDVCLVSPGIHSYKLEKLCAKNGWSYLSVRRNSPGVALNKAIKLHPSADYIYKLDEDIFISSGFFEKLYLGYKYSWRESRLEPGFVAPVINVNGISYGVFLSRLGLEDSYRKEFGEILLRCGDLPIHNNPEACWWVWRNSLPFDAKASEIERHGPSFSFCGTRFSIGAIMFRREFIVKIGGFKSAWHSGVLGVDEDMLCRDCVSHSRPMYIIESVFAGHFSFYPQENYMRAKLADMSAIDPEAFPTSVYAAPLN